jgi:hypothetical protein
MIHSLAMILSAVLFGAEGRFDLVCGVPDYDGQPAKAATHVRVDLAKGLYCIDDCQAGQLIAAVSETAIVLFDGSDGGRHRMRTSIVRNDAGQPVLHLYRGSHPDRAGACEIRPFSGIPDREPPLPP